MEMEQLQKPTCAVENSKSTKHNWLTVWARLISRVISSTKLMFYQDNKLPRFSKKKKEKERKKKDQTRPSQKTKAKLTFLDQW